MNSEPSRGHAASIVFNHKTRTGSPLKLTRRATTLGGLGLLATSAMSNKASAFDRPLTDLVEGTEDFGTAVDAYIYGYPMVTLEMTRRRLTNVTKADETRAPMGQIVKMRSYPDASYRDITGPNADTLYTTAFPDVGDEPWVLSAPDMKGRYFMLPFLDGWTSVFAGPGSRTAGTQAQTFLITGPGWSGTVPAGMTQLKSKTSLVWLIGRIYCTGTPEDYAEVHALQDQFKLQPLSSWGKDYTPPPGEVDPSVDMKTPTRDQVNGLSAVKFFTLLADLLKRNPPYAADAPALARFKAIGLVPGQSFDGAHLEFALGQAAASGGIRLDPRASPHADARKWLISTTKRASMARTILSALSSPPSDWEPTARRTRSIPSRSGRRFSKLMKAPTNMR